MKTRILNSLIGLLGIFAAIFPAKAEFPEREITIVVGFSAGGLADQGARIWADSATKFLGRPIIVLNRVGGSGVIAATHVANAAPDGYTLGFFTPAPFVILPHFSPVPYSVPDSFETILTEYVNPIILAANADAPFNTVAEFVRYAKERPGELNYSVSAAAGIERFGVERFQQAAGIKLTMVPYKGSGESVTALLGKHVQLTAASLPDLKQQFDAGTLKPVVSFGFNRSDMPSISIPTARESGFDATAITYSGLLAPKGTPKETLLKLHDSFKKAQETPEFLNAISRLNMGIRYSDGEEFRKQIKADFDINKKIIDTLGLK
jgi:tripartite-type tricarboxylate transporter receptor subunit TctC